MIRAKFFLGKAPIASYIVTLTVVCSMQAMGNRGFLVHRSSPSLLHPITAMQLRPFFFGRLELKKNHNYWAVKEPFPWPPILYLTQRKSGKIPGSLMLIRCLSCDTGAHFVSIAVSNPKTVRILRLVKRETSPKTLPNCPGTRRAAGISFITILFRAGTHGRGTPARIGKLDILAVYRGCLSSRSHNSHFAGTFFEQPSILGEKQFRHLMSPAGWTGREYTSAVWDKILDAYPVFSN